jgi:hypothetical protein
VVAWDLAGQAELVDGWLASHVEHRSRSPVYLGGDHALAEDQQALGAFANDDPAMVLILVKGWEPPLLACMDVLQSLRARVGSEVSLVVVPLGLELGTPESNELDAWHYAVAKLADPGTYVEAVA